MDSRARLLTSSDAWRSPSAPTYYRRASVDRRLDQLTAGATTTPSLAARVCRPRVIATVVLLLAAGAATFYFTRQAIESNALGLNTFLTKQVLDNSQLVADQIYGVVLSSAESIHEPFEARIEPIDEEHNATTTLFMTNTTV